MWKQFRDVSLLMTQQGIADDVRDQYLETMLEYAKQNICFYQDLGDVKNLEEFPVINKKIIKERYSDFIAPIDIIPCQEGNLHIQKTSGSTGTPFEIPQDTRCRIRRIATIKAENERLGFHSFEPMMHLRAIKHYWDWTHDDIVYRKDLNIVYADNSNLDERKLRRIVDAINHYKVKVVRGYMTTLDTLSRYVVEHDLDMAVHPTFISVGEPLLESLRLRIIDMGCRIVSQYANEENGVFGQSPINQPGSNIILNGANCIVEILKIGSDEPVADNELGRIVVTDFTNYALPMIRYEIGDAAMVGDIKNGRIVSLKNLSGRTTDLIYRTDGTTIDMFNSMPPTIYNGELVKQWQFVQHNALSYSLTISTDFPDVVSAKRREYENALKCILGDDAAVSILVVNEIPVMMSGKRKTVVSEYKNKSQI